MSLTAVARGPYPRDRFTGTRPRAKLVQRPPRIVRSGAVQGVPVLRANRGASVILHGMPSAE